MRGFPLLQSILVVLAVLLAGVPVYRLTRPASAAGVSVQADTPDPAPSEKPASLTVAATFAPSPVDFEIKNLGQTVLAGRGPQAQFTTGWSAAVPAEGVDLVVQAHWPTPASGDPKAMRVLVRFPDGVLFEKTFWATAAGELHEVCTVPGDVHAE